MPEPRRARSASRRDPLSTLPAPLRQLCQAAQKARAGSYAPYSHFHVGAAVKTRDGRVFLGANVENASYGLSVCAERTAVLSAVQAGGRELDAVAVCTDLSPPAPPCGMCRQTLAEFASDCEVVLCGPKGVDITPVRVRLSQLLPTAFSPESLHAFAAQQKAREDGDTKKPVARRKAGRGPERK